MVYRAYRAPYAWVPQLPSPRQTAIARLDKTVFRVPGAAPLGRDRVTVVGGAESSRGEGEACVVSTGGGT